MGLVYEAEDLIMGKIKTTPQHHEAGSFALAQTFPEDTPHLDSNGNPIFLSAAVYGSSIDNNGQSPSLNIRSDLDYIVVHSPGEEPENYTRRFLEKLGQQIKSSYGVVLEAQPHTYGEPPHDQSHASHIVDINERLPQWCVNNPGRLFQDYLIKDGDVGAHTLSSCLFLIVKANYFDDTERMKGLPNNKTFQRCLELSNSIGRKVIPAICSPDEIIPKVSDKAGIRALLDNKVVSLFGGQADEVLKNQRSLTQMDADYTTLLMDCLSDYDTINNAGMPETQKRIALSNLKDRYNFWIDSRYDEALSRAARLCRSWQGFMEKSLQQWFSDEVIRDALDGSENSQIYDLSSYT